MDQKEEKEEKEGKEEEPPFRVIPLQDMILRALLHTSIPPPLSLYYLSEEEEIPSWLFEPEVKTPPPKRHYEEAQGDDEDDQPLKRSRSNDPPPIDYNFIQLQSGEEIYFNEEDGTQLLLPESIEPNQFVRKIIAKLPVPMKSRLFYLAKFMNEKSSYDHDRLLYHHLSKQVSAAYIKEYRLRSLFRTFLHRWRIRRMDRRYTKEIDPITLSEPEKEVFVYDQRVNKKFVFEAKSISHVVETAFLYHEGGFAIPHMPRNPWTNLEFSYAQLISIYYQLKHHNELGWCLHTLREYNFDKTMWHLYHHSTITMTAIKTSLRLLDSLDARELLEDFIFSKMEELEIHTTSSIQSAYRLAILKVPRHWYLEQCKQIAYLHYESQHFNRNQLQLINQKCKQLFKKQSIFLKDLVQQRVISHI